VTFRILAVALGTLVGLLGIEAGFRILRIKPARFPPPRYVVLDSGAYRDFGDRWGRFHIKRPSRFESLGVKMGEYVPGSRFKMVYADNPRGYFDADNGVPFVINSLGLRGREVERRKPAGTYRILGIGDSFTLGAGVRDDDTFLRRLESSLNAGGARRYEVLNAGVEGYNTRDEVLYLERQWLALDPDLVLIGFYLNDAYSDVTFATTIHGMDLGVYLGQPDGLARYSYVWDYVLHALRTQRVQARVEKFYRASYFSEPKRFLEIPGSIEVDWPMSRAALRHAVELARRRNIQIALVIFPELFRLDKDYPFAEVHRLVMDACAALSLPALDLLETYRGTPSEKLWVHVTDHHPNEVAHELAARAIEKFLRERVLPEE